MQLLHQLLLSAPLGQWRSHYPPHWSESEWLFSAALLGYRSDSAPSEVGKLSCSSGGSGSRGTRRNEWAC